MKPSLKQQPQRSLPSQQNNQVRLQKYIAMNSNYSRRKAEELILLGKISVNGKIIEEMGTRVDPDKDSVEIEGKPIQKNEEKIYLMLNKPAGFVTTRADLNAKKTVMELIKYKNVYPVGRLDKDTEGLLLFTNDGDFAYKLTHPKFEHEKEYIVYLKKPFSPANKQLLENGIMIDFKKTAPCKIYNIQTNKNLISLSIVIHEGRKRQIRRMFEKIGNPLVFLKRVRVGKIMLGDLPQGEVRFLTADEIKSV